MKDQKTNGKAEIEMQEYKNEKRTTGMKKQELRNRNRNTGIKRQEDKSILTFLLFHSRIFIPAFLFLFSFFPSSCAPSKHSSFPKEWQQISQPPSVHFSSDQEKKYLKIIVLNVGQGDSTLIQTPNGKVILIDAGANGKGKEVILPYLQTYQIKYLAAIIATHYDADHIGGIDEVIEGPDDKLDTEDDFFPELGIFDRGGTPLDSSPLYSEYLKAVQKERITLEAGIKIEIDPEVSIRCVAVNGQVWNGESFDLFQA